MSATPQRGTTNPLSSDRETELNGTPEFTLEPQLGAVADDNVAAEPDVNPSRP